MGKLPWSKISPGGINLIPCLVWIITFPFLTEALFFCRFPKIANHFISTWGKVQGQTKVRIGIYVGAHPCRRFHHPCRRDPLFSWGGCLRAYWGVAGSKRGNLSSSLPSSLSTWLSLVIIILVIVFIIIVNVVVTIMVCHRHCHQHDASTLSSSLSSLLPSSLSSSLCCPSRDHHCP